MEVFYYSAHTYYMTLNVLFTTPRIIHQMQWKNLIQSTSKFIICNSIQEIRLISSNTIAEQFQSIWIQLIFSFVSWAFWLDKDKDKGADSVNNEFYIHTIVFCWKNHSFINKCMYKIWCPKNKHSNIPYWSPTMKTPSSEFQTHFKSTLCTSIEWTACVKMFQCASFNDNLVPQLNKFQVQIVSNFTPLFRYTSHVIIEIWRKRFALREKSRK